MENDISFKIKINDGYCEWEYLLLGGREYSLSDLIDIITVHTKAKVIERRPIPSNDLWKLKEI